MVRVDNIILDEKLEKPKQSTTVVIGELEVFIPLSGVIDVDKDSKTVNVNKSGEGTNVKVGITGVKVNDKDGKSIVNIPFIPIFIFAFCVLGGLLFFIYKIAELIIAAFK